jgi:hypothetical protein
MQESLSAFFRENRCFAELTRRRAISAASASPAAGNADWLQVPATAEPAEVATAQNQSICA